MYLSIKPVEAMLTFAVVLSLAYCEAHPLRSISSPFLHASMNMDEVIEGESSSGDSPVNATIAVIIAREFIEMVMFVVSHVGSVLKHPKMSNEDKYDYVRYLLGGIFLGIFFGGCISMAVGFSLAAAYAQIDQAKTGIESGEAASKLIAAVFVFSLTMKLPIWFGISNFKPKRDGNTLEDDDDKFVESKWAMSTNLFWNILRETTEAGVYTSIVVVLNEDSKETLGQSIGVGIGAATVLGALMSLGARYISAKVFGILATALSGLLTVGLTTSASRSLEEVYETSRGGKTPTLFLVEGDSGNVLSSLAFVGLGPEWTVLQLVVAIVGIIFVTAASLRQNYFGYPLVPEVITTWFDGKVKGFTGYLGIESKETDTLNKDVELAPVIAENTAIVEPGQSPASAEQV